MHRDKFQDLDNEELKILASLAVNTLHDRGIMYSTVISPAPKPPDMFDNAKFEQIACNGLKPAYNGSSSDLIPTLNAIHFRRQNEVWCSATMLQQDGKELDLIRHFLQAKHEVILEQAQVLWDPEDSMTQRHIRGTKTYNSRLFAVFLMNSITNDFANLLHSRINPKNSSDGPLLFFTM